MAWGPARNRKDGSTPRGGLADLLEGLSQLAEDEDDLRCSPPVRLLSRSSVAPCGHAARPRSRLALGSLRGACGSRTRGLGSATPRRSAPLRVPNMRARASLCFPTFFLTQRVSSSEGWLAAASARSAGCACASVELQPEAQGDKKPETALSNLEPLGSMSSRLWERLVWLLGDSGENGSQR